MANNQITGLFSYDNNTGLKVSSRKEIINDLTLLTQVAYGQDYVIEQGNSWYSFLDLLAGSLVTLGNTTQKVYNALSAESTAGAELDNVVSLFGLVRKVKTASNVSVKMTIPDTSNLTLPLYLQEKAVLLRDSNNYVWTNKEAIYIYPYKFNEEGIETQVENRIGSCLFEATGQIAVELPDGKWDIGENTVDETKVFLGAFNNGTSDFTGSDNGLMIMFGKNDDENTSLNPTNILFVNELNSISGWGDETDAQLRARWAKGMFSKSVGTIEGLEAQLINNTDVSYVKILENTGNEESTGNAEGLPAGIAGHSIWVIVNGKSTWDGATGTYSQDPSDLEIADTILRYKSIGCGVSKATDAQVYDSNTGTGLVSVKLTYRSEEYIIYFSRAVAAQTTVKLTLKYNGVKSPIGDDIQVAVAENIRNNVLDAINALGMHKDLTNAILISAAQKALDNRNLPTINISADSGTMLNVGYDKYVSLNTAFNEDEYINGVWVYWDPTATT